jgi:hypothetical protein
VSKYLYVVDQLMIVGQVLRRSTFWVDALVLLARYFEALVLDFVGEFHTVFMA